MKAKVQLLKISLVVLFYHCSIFQLVQGQELIYEGFLNDKKVGELTAVREVNDENTKITINTSIEAHLLVKINIELYSESTYTNQSLLQASSIAKVHGHLKSDVQTIKKGNIYEVEIDGETKILNKNSLIGADIFYFEEPENISAVYALATGEILEVKKGDKNVYYFEHDGKKEYHKYSGGVLEELKITHTLYTITFKRRTS